MDIKCKIDIKDKLQEERKHDEPGDQIKEKISALQEIQVENCDPVIYIKRVKEEPLEDSREEEPFYVKIEDSEEPFSTKIEDIENDEFFRQISEIDERQEEEGENSTYESVEELKESIQDYDPPQPTAHDTPCSSSEARPIQSTPKKTPPASPSKRSYDKCDFVLQTIEHHFNKPQPQENRYDVFGKNVALKIKDVSNSTQRLLVEKIINDALFMAEMGQLTMSHTIRDSINSTFSVCSSSQQFNNNCPQSQTRTYNEPLSPVIAQSSENLNQSVETID